MRVPQRGRAIIHRLSAQDAMRTFRPGDILLTTSDGALARLLGWATGSELNHAALIIGSSGAMIEATPTFQPGAQAFRTASVRDYLGAGRPCWLGYVELREGTRQDVVAFAEHMLRAGRPASLLGRCWLALHMLLAIAPRAWARRAAARIPALRPLADYLDAHAVVLREEHTYSSAEFVARALERGGFIWDRDPAHVTPDELFQRYHLAEFTPVAPVPISRARRTVASTRAAPSVTATITPFTLRGVQGATALAELPDSHELPQSGLHALLQVSILAVAGLTVIGMVEELIHLAARDE